MVRILVHILGICKSISPRGSIVCGPVCAQSFARCSQALPQFGTIHAPQPMAGHALHPQHKVPLTLDSVGVSSVRVCLCCATCILEWFESAFPQCLWTSCYSPLSVCQWSLSVKPLILSLFRFQYFALLTYTSPSQACKLTPFFTCYVRGNLGPQSFDMTASLHVCESVCGSSYCTKTTVLIINA